MIYLQLVPTILIIKIIIILIIKKYYLIGAVIGHSNAAYSTMHYTNRVRGKPIYNIVQVFVRKFFRFFIIVCIVRTSVKLAEVIFEHLFIF